MSSEEAAEEALLTFLGRRRRLGLVVLGWGRRDFDGHVDLVGKSEGEELMLVSVLVRVVGSLDALDLAADELLGVLLPETNSLAHLSVAALVARLAEICNPPLATLARHHYTWGIAQRPCFD